MANRGRHGAPAAPKNKAPKLAKSRGKKKAAKPTKAEQVEVRAVPSQMGLNLPKERDRKHHTMTILGLKAKMDEAKGRYAKACQDADAAGIDVKALLMAAKMQKKDSLDVASHFQQMALFFDDLNLPVRFRMFDPGAGDTLEQAARDGERDGEAAKPAQTTWPEGSKEHAIYMERWQKAQAGNAMKLGSQEPAGNA